MCFFYHRSPRLWGGPRDLLWEPADRTRARAAARPQAARSGLSETANPQPQIYVIIAFTCTAIFLALLFFMAHATSQ